MVAFSNTEIFEKKIRSVDVQKMSQGNQNHSSVYMHCWGHSCPDERCMLGVFQLGYALSSGTINPHGIECFLTVVLILVCVTYVNFPMSWEVHISTNHNLT